MKIALLNFGRVNNAFGGAEKVFFDMANNLHRLGHQVTAIVHDTHSGSPGFPIDEQVHYYNCRISFLTNVKSHILRSVVSLFSKQSKQFQIKIDYKFRPRAPKIQKVLDKEKPEVIITFHPNETFFIKKYLKTKAPIVSMFHIDPSKFDNNEAQLYYTSLKECELIQVLMPEYVDSLQKTLNRLNNIIVIPNIVPQYDQQSTCTHPVIVNVARLCPHQKRQHLIIEAFNLLKDEFPHWRVELWGDFKERPKYTSKLSFLIKKYHLENQVHICGPTKEVPKKLLNASIFCFPSAYEGMPLSMTEAMSLGLPTIGCKTCSSVNSLIHHGENGFLCADTPEDIAKYLRILMADLDLRQKMGRHAREDMKQYAPEVIWKRWDDVLKKVQARVSVIK